MGNISCLVEMDVNQLLEKWAGDSAPAEEKVDNVIKVIEAIFEKWEWHKRRPYIIVRDKRLEFFRKKVFPQDKLLAPDGAFSIPTVKGRFVIRQYLKNIITLKEIAERAERYVP